MDVHRVVITAVPAQLYLDSLRHALNITRELLLIKSGHRTGVSIAPRQLGELLDDIHHRFAAQITSAMDASARALAAGLTEMDVVWDVPRGEENAAGRLLSLLEQADEFARQGLLLELPATPSMAALRRRIAAEIVAATTRPSR